MSDFSNQIASLVEGTLPVEVDSEGRQDDWEVDGPALLVAATRQLRALEHLQEEFPSALVGWQLLRSMYEYITTYAWIAVDPDVRAHQWMVSDYKERVKLLDNYAELGQELLPEEDRDRLTEVADSGDAMPRSLVDRARDADAAWEETLRGLQDRLPEDGRSFSALYPLIYRGGSRFTHPTTHGVAAFVDENRRPVTIGDEKELRSDLTVVGASILALGLTVATDATPGLGIAFEDIRGACSN